MLQEGCLNMHPSTSLRDREKKQLGPGCFPIHANQSFILEGQGFHGGQGGQYGAPRDMWP